MPDAPHVTTGVIADWVGGEIIGDSTTDIMGVATLEEATPSDVSYLATREYVKRFASSAAGAVLVGPDHANLPEGPQLRIVVSDPMGALVTLLERLYPEPEVPSSIDPTAIIRRGATLGAEVVIGPNVVIGENGVLADGTRLGPGCVVGDGVHIGASSVLVARVTVYPGSRIGNRVLLHAGVVVGADGFGFEPRPEGTIKIPQVGGVVIHDDVEIGANSAVDRGTITDTVIGPGTKIDNLVQVGHNVKIGARCLIAGAVAIGGSSIIEDDVILAGQAGIAGHLTIGAGARVGAQAGVLKSLPSGGDYTGTPTRTLKEYQRVTAATHRLAKISKVLEEIADERERRA